MINLTDIIKENPDCTAIIDNDWWELRDIEGNLLVDSDGDFEPLGDGGYGSGNCYGGDILQALAKIVGITVESV